MTSEFRPFLGRFLAQLAAAGVHQAVIAPGSRSTPLAILLREHSEIEVTVALDERSGAYFALGLAKVSEAPVALLCTSGTAAANFLPAIAEARLSRIPLIVLTADRPRELRDVGAPQTMDQIHLYGSHVKWFQDLPTPVAGLEHFTAEAAARAVHQAMSQPRGPVHFNFPFREPLLPEPGDMPGPMMGGQYSPDLVPSTQGINAALEWVSGARRPIIALGPEAPDIDPGVLDRARALNIPIFADPLCRNGRPSNTVTAYDSFLHADKAFPRPDAVIQIGALFTSKVFTQWVQGSRLVLADWPLGYRNPDHLETVVVEGDPNLTLAGLIERLSMQDVAFLDQLYRAEAAAQEAIDRVLAASPANFEGRFYRTAAELWGPRREPILAASSMPVRDFDTFYHHGNLRILANRGANGIDGLVSTAMGISHHTGDVLAVLGDLAFHHDLTGLIYGQKCGVNALIVVLNNAGGGIFSYLPQTTLDPAVFEELFGTPHSVDFSGVAQLYGAQFCRADTYDEFRAHFLALRDKPGLRVLEWRTAPRTASAAIHRAIYS